MADRIFNPGDLHHADDEALAEGTERLRQVIERLERQANYLDLWDRYMAVHERLRQHGYTDLLPREG